MKKLPYSGNIQEAMKKQDRDAIKEIMKGKSLIKSKKDARNKARQIRMKQKQLQKDGFYLTKEMIHMDIRLPEPQKGINLKQLLQQDKNHIILVTEKNQNEKNYNCFSIKDLNGFACNKGDKWLYDVKNKIKENMLWKNHIFLFLYHIIHLLNFHHYIVYLIYFIKEKNFFVKPHLDEETKLQKEIQLTASYKNTAHGNNNYFADQIEWFRQIIVKKDLILKYMKFKHLKK